MLLLILVLVVIVVYNNSQYKKSEYYQQSKTPLFEMMTDKGKYGEYLTYKKLISLEGYKKFLFNCYVPKENGETTEIDVIMIHETGIYVFESKNFSGWIFGTETHKQWTQTLPVGRGKTKKSYFLNPIIQNKVHIKWLETYLNRKLPIYSFIVFSDRCTLKDIKLTSNTHYVINRYNVMAAVRNNIAAAEPVLYASDIDSLYNKLYTLTQVSEAVRIAHVYRIQEKMQDKHEEKAYDTKGNKADVTVSIDEGTDRLCPRCGAKLVLRTARRGENAGNQFWGCSNYPKCRYIENIDK